MDDKRKAVYSTIINFPTLEEARASSGDIAKSLLLRARQTTMFITNLSKSTKIKQELLDAGFTERQIPGWVGSLNDDKSLDDDVNVGNVNVGNAGNVGNAVVKAESAKTASTGGRIKRVQPASLPAEPASQRLP